MLPSAPEGWVQRILPDGPVVGLERTVKAVVVLTRAPMENVREFTVTVAEAEADPPAPVQATE